MHKFTLAATRCGVIWLIASLWHVLVWAGERTLRMLIQQSPLAGSQYYALGEVFADIRVGDALELSRESDNRHDGRAIKVSWHGRQIGYLPRAQNRAVSVAMYQGDRLSARVSSLSDNKNPWQRVSIEVFIEL